MKIDNKKNPTLILDLETGGLDENIHAICSCSVNTLDGLNPKNWYIAPYGKYYSEEALEINNISLDELDTSGTAVEYFILELIEYCNIQFGKDNFGKIQLLGQNISFDIKFLKELMNIDSPITRNNQVFQFKDLFHYHFKDSMILANSLKDVGLIPQDQSISLQKLYIYLFGEDENSKNAHNSENDVEMTRKVYLKLLNMIKNDTQKEE